MTYNVFGGTLSLTQSVSQSYSQNRCTDNGDKLSSQSCYWSKAHVG